MVIPAARAEDAGVYTCNVTNAESSVEISTILVVTGVVPYFAQAPNSYKQFKTLPDAYLQFEIRVSFKPESEDGLFLFNGQNNQGSGDFGSFGLQNGFQSFGLMSGLGPP